MLDDIDKRTLRTLQRDGRLQNVELAKKVGLSPSPCLRRVRLLEESGVIERYVAMVDGSKVGMGLTLFVRGWFKAQDAETTSRFTEAIKKLPQVVECHLMAGVCHALLRIINTDISSHLRFPPVQFNLPADMSGVTTTYPMSTDTMS